MSFFILTDIFSEHIAFVRRMFVTPKEKATELREEAYNWLLINMYDEMGEMFSTHGRLKERVHSEGLDIG
jgi:hypothetical protein